MKHFEKQALGLFPTPMYRLPNISRELGTNVWIKRDDLCGVALGGNKVRNLEYLLHDAKSKGYDLVMTTGQAQSNHAMLIGEDLGRKVYKIPCGGSNTLGTLGYIDCMKEVADSGLQFDHLVCACGSGGTAAGCTLGAKLYLPGTKVMCSMVDNEPFDVIVPRLMQEAADLLDVSTEMPVPDLLPMWGPGYSIPSTEGNEAVSMMMKLEGIVLDTCYTGKAFAGLVRRAKEGFYQPDDNVLFIHTGGAGGLFAQDWEAE